MGWMRRRETWLAIGGGASAALAMPGFGAAPLVFIALIPLFRAWEGRRGFLCGYLFGLTLFAIDVRWVLTLFRFNALVVPGYLLLVAYLALPFGVAGWLLTLRKGRADAWRWLILAPALFVLAEWVRTLGVLGIGFSMLHQALFRVPWLIQSAAFLGSWSITAFVVAVNGALYLAWRRRSCRFLLSALVLVLVQASFGWLPSGSEGGVSLAVAIVSSNVEQEVKLDGRHLESLATRFLRLGERAIETDPDLVVFPESFLPSYLLDEEALFSRFAELARAGQFSLLLGTGTLKGGQIFNSVVLVDPEGSVVGAYDMVRPVPFGEYIPGRALLEAIGLGAWAQGLLPIDLSRGTSYDPLDGIGTPICFESTFPTASRQLVRNGAKLLVTLTNDAWFAGSSEIEAHFAAAVFRAVETRRSVVQAANGGISGIVDGRGRIRASTSEETVLTGLVRRSAAQSLYARIGDAPLLAAMAAVVLVSLVHQTARRARPAPERPAVAGEAKAESASRHGLPRNRDAA